MDGMETTFISIHDLDPECRIMYCSDSVMDVLGYEPDDIVEKSCWEFFHPDEIPLARAKHGRSVMMDKAAVLSYCRMKHSDGSWIGCEVVFTIVYDVLVGCTSIYNRGLRADARAAEAPGIRRVFSTNPRDPRYHMLQHLSTKFTTMPRAATMREPRAALFLNRYTRTLTIMYATDGLADVLGISGDEMRGLSLYFCMTDDCLPDAIKCLENAKANDSIAYLRFFYDEPRGKDGTRQREELERFDRESSVDVDGDADVDGESVESDSGETSPEHGTPAGASASGSGSASNGAMAPLRPSSSSGVDSTVHTHEAVFGERQVSEATATTNSAQSQSRSPGRRIELEAVISCTSDGLVVCLRVAQPVINNNIPGLAPDQRSYAPQRIASFDPQPQTVFSPLHQRNVATQQRQANAARTRAPRSAGVYAVPWSTTPMLPQPQHQARAQPTSSYARSGYDDNTYPQSTSTQQDFMNSIQEMAVFAWAIVGINGTFADFSVGTPRGMAQPPAGLSIWKPDPNIALASDGCVANHQVPGHMLRNGGPGSGVDGGHASTSETRNGRSTQVDNTYASYTTQPPPLPNGSSTNSSTSGTTLMNSAGGHMVDGHDNSHHYTQTSLHHDRTLPGFEQFKQANRSPTAPMVDGVGQMVDGVGSPTNYRHGSASSSEKTPGSNNFGFKDPGSSSKSTANFYNPALQNLAPGGKTS